MDNRYVVAQREKDEKTQEPVQGEEFGNYPSKKAARAARKVITRREVGKFQNFGQISIFRDGKLVE